MNAVVEAPDQIHTVGDLERLSAAGERYELIEGELRKMSPAGARHGTFTSRLHVMLSAFVYAHKLGECTAAETGFKVETMPPTVLAPDWAFIRHDRLPIPIPKGFYPVIPEAVLETRSPGDSEKWVARKTQLWLNAGVRAVMNLDLERKQLVIHRQSQPAEVLGPDSLLTLPDVLPGFSANLAQAFPPR